MSNNTNLVKSFSMVPSTLAEAMEYAKLIANSELVPKDYRGKPGNVLVAVQMGGEVGLKPLQALQNIAVINGRPAIWGDAALALVKSHPECEDVLETLDGTGEKMIATCVIKREGKKDVIKTFSVDDAKRAKLWGKEGPWQTYPQRMLQMRARSWAMRDQFPDALKGLGIAEEVQDIPPTKDMGAADVVSDPVINPEQLKQIMDECLRTGITPVRVAGMYGVNVIESLPAKNFDEAMARLKEKPNKPKSIETKPAAQTATEMPPKDGATDAKMIGDTHPQEKPTVETGAQA